MDFCWAAGAKRSNSTKKKKRRRRRTSRAPFSSWLSETQREQWNGCEAFFLRLYNVTTQLLNLPCLRYFLLLPVYPLLPRQKMSDVWFFWHMWSTVSLNVPAPFISATLCTPVLISTLLFIAGPSEPPSLNIIIVIIIIAHILSDPSSSFFFQLPAAGEESREKRQGVGQNCGWATSFFVSFLPCVSEKLPKSPAVQGWGARSQTAQELLRSCQSCSLML